MKIKNEYEIEELKVTEWLNEMRARNTENMKWEWKKDKNFVGLKIHNTQHKNESSQLRAWRMLRLST